MVQATDNSGVASAKEELQKASETAAATKVTNYEDDNSWDTLKPLIKRYWPVLVITWTLHLGLGLCISITGPTLPYLAINTGQTLGSVSFLYTVRSIVVCITSIAVGLLIARLDSSRSKLLLLLTGSCLTAAYALLTPFMPSLATLILAQCLFGVGAGIVDTVDNMLVIYLFGPVLSRSFSHSLHFCVGIGGFLAPLLARPFLEAMGGDLGSNVAICGGTGRDNSSSANATAPVSLEPLKWPYAIVGGLHSLWLVGYVALLLLHFQLVKFAPPGRAAELEANKAEKTSVAEAETTLETMEVTVTPRRMSRRRQAAVVALFVLFYVLHVGQENTFWSHLYSFGVCSQRLRLSPAQASLLSTIFFVGFLVSRALGIVVARLLRPALILLVQLTGCLIATVMLAIWGELSPAMAYACSGLYGFCIAMVFPTGITWLASKMEVTGALSSAWFIGAYVGISTYPLAAGQLIASSAGAISMMYLAAGTSGAYLIVVAAMFFIAR